MAWRILQYIKHLFFLRYRKGHGIHSPYLFKFLHEVVFNQPGKEVPEKILQVHQAMRKDRSLIPVEQGAECGARYDDGYGTGFGAGSKTETTYTRTIRSFVRRSSVSIKYGALLYRIAHWFQPGVMLELGTGLGISAIYLAAGAPECILHTVEGSKGRAGISEQVIKRCALNKVKVYRGAFQEKLEELVHELKGRFVAFVDGDHRYEPTLEYVRVLVERAGDEAVIVMDDIYWSEGMYLAWKEVISWPEVRVSVDLFYMGILLLRRDLNKTCVKIKF